MPIITNDTAKLSHTFWIAFIVITTELNRIIIVHDETSGGILNFDFHIIY